MVASHHYMDVRTLLAPQNLLSRFMVRNMYDLGFPMEVLPDNVTNLDKMEYPIWSSAATSGLGERVQGAEARMSGGSLDRAVVQAIEYGEKMPILENDNQLLVNVRNNIVDTLSDNFILKKSELKWKYITNNGATPDTTNDEVNTWTGTGIQGSNPAAFDGYYLQLDGTTEWNDETNGDPFSNLGAAKRRVQEEEHAGNAEHIIWSSRIGEVLIGRADMQKILAQNSNLASASGGMLSVIRDMTVHEVDVFEKAVGNPGTETQLNRDVATVTIGANLGLTHVSERENFVVIDKLDDKRSIEIELRTKFTPFVQRFGGAFSIFDAVDN